MTRPNKTYEGLLVNKLIGKLTLLLILCLPITVQSVSLTEPLALREKLPIDDTVAYLRIPNPTEFFSLAGATEAQQQQLQDLQKSFYQNVLKEVGKLTQPLLMNLIHHLRSPLEAAFLLPENMPLPLGNLLISAQLDIESLDGLTALLKKMTTDMPTLKITSPLSKDGLAALTAEPIFIFLHYDVEHRLLNLMGGMSTNQELFQQTVEQLKKVEDHPMYALENSIDASHQGLFKWMNVKKLLPMFLASLSPEDVQKLEKWGLLEARGLAAGWGTTEGKKRLKWILDIPRAGYRKLFPEIINKPTLSTAGKPKLVSSFAFPMEEALAAFEKIMESEADAEELKKYQAFQKEFTQEFGFSLQEAAQAIGRETLFFADDVGVFAAIKHHDREQFKKVLAALVKKFKLSDEERTIDDKTYHHLVVPSLLFLDKLPSPETEGEALFYQLLQRIGNHYYWAEEEDYLILANVPQLLFDRQRHTQQVKLETWLQESQHQQVHSSLFFFSTNIPDVPRYFYHAYLGILNILGDLAQKKIDLFTLPTASELKLPTEGTYGLQLDISDPFIALELTFEKTPFDFLVNQGMLGVAVVGVMAAIAIPAYTDYMKRSKVAEGLQLLDALKTPAEEFYAAKKRLPKVEEISGKTNGQYVKSIKLLESKEGYAAEFNDPELVGQLKLIFDVDSGIWHCTSEGMNEKYVPSSCQQEEVSEELEEEEAIEEEPEPENSEEEENSIEEEPEQNQPTKVDSNKSKP